MNEIIKLVIRYQHNMEDYIFEQIVNHYQNLIFSIIKNESKFNQEDIYQDMLFALYKVIKNFKIINIIPNDITEKQLKMNKYFSSFINKYNYFDLIDLTHECNNFYNENQFNYYVKQRLKSIYIDYLKSNKYFNNKKYSLNLINENNIELIDLVLDPSTLKQISYLDLIDLTEEEKQFLKCFIENGQVLSEKEVGIKLGMSQQAVNKKKKKIKEKYENLNSSC